MSEKYDSMNDTVHACVRLAPTTKDLLLDWFESREERTKFAGDDCSFDVESTDKATRKDGLVLCRTGTSLWIVGRRSFGNHHLDIVSHE